MSFRKVRQLKVSERVFDIVCEQLDLDASEDGVKIDGYLMCYNNGTIGEQGYVLSVSSTDFDNKNHTQHALYIWANEAKNSDNIIIRWQRDYPNNGRFSDETDDKRKVSFSYDEIQKAAKFITGLVKEHFEREYYYGG